MMKIVDAKQMQELDRRTIEDIGIPGIVLMENAALNVVNCIERYYPEDIRKGIINVLCGPGNNGGDGLAVARHLYNRGFQVEVILLTEPEKIKGDARTNLIICQRMNVRMLVASDVASFERDARASIDRSTIIIDAIFGTGLKSKINDFLAEVIRCVNSSNKIVISVDIPSGISADTGGILGSCVMADLTITFGLPKVGLSIFPGASCVGRLEITNISIPFNLIEASPFEAKLIEKRDVANKFLPRPIDSHKGSYGHLLVLAGSRGKTGAAYLATIAALRVGAGLVTLGIPESLNDIMAAKLEEAMTWPLPETPEQSLGSEALDVILKQIDRFQALVIGPGLSTNQKTVRLIQELITKINIPVIIDADSLNALAGEWEMISKSGLCPIMTPHPGEMARLMSIPTDYIQANRLKIVKEAANKYGAYMILKGAGTLISNLKGTVWLNPTGNPGMATGGTGDVLAGMIGGLLAQGYNKEESCWASVYLHGLAGDLAREQQGEASLIAKDVIDFIPKAILAVLQL